MFSSIRVEEGNWTIQTQWENGRVIKTEVTDSD